jgi:thiopeptide-type bacteriocin biosynthesis protein
MFCSPLLSESLFIASPDLSKVSHAWLSGEQIPEKDVNKLLLTLRKYLLRMAYRCTPFGLFAGVSRITWGSSSIIQLVGQSDYERHTRLDMDYLCALATTISREPAVRNELIFYPNNTLYPVGEQLRYIEYTTQQQTRKHTLITVDRSEYLEQTLELARFGCTTLELTHALVSDEITVGDAQEFIDELIDSQILMSELEPVLTGEDYLDKLIRTLRKHQAVHPVLVKLELMRKHLQQLDRSTNFGSDKAENYQVVVEAAHGIGIAFERNNLFQVDMHKPTCENILTEVVQQEIRRVVELLSGLNTQPTAGNLQQFRTAFIERYEQQEVPLVQALDTEMGIGYPAHQQANVDPAPLIHDWPFVDPVAADNSVTSTEWQRFLLGKYLRAVETRDNSITLEDEELAAFLTPSLPLATSLYCLGSLLASSAQALDAGDFYFIHQVTAGPSAANLLGRFCHLNTSLTNDVRELLRVEEQQQPELVFAEIVHINQARIGNISTRPILRNYEIPILVQAGVDEEHTIYLQDLFVSVRGGQLVLRSKRLNKQVIPRLSSAHNFSLQALPIYHFLCDLQSQQINRALTWDWDFLKNSPFLPRVLYNKTILAKARWVLSASETKQLREVNSIEIMDFVMQLRAKYRIPAWVIITEGDNKLPINLASALHLEVLQNVLRHVAIISLEECLFHADNLFVNSLEGGFTNEFVFPIRTIQPQKHIPELQLGSSAEHTEHIPSRTFSLGSEWLYVKLYCGLKTADNILTKVVVPLVRTFWQDKVIDQWFFVRYEDPEHHLRIRFHGQGHFYGLVIEALHQALVPYEEVNLLHALRTDVYRRELERYGLYNITNSEALFFHDSEATLQILSMLDGERGDHARWLLALRSVDMLLTDFGYTLSEKHTLLFQLQDKFKLEFNSISAESRKVFGSRYRKARVQIEEVMRIHQPEEYELIPALDILYARSKAWAPVVQQILVSIKDKTVEIPLNELLSSYVHMTLNRFFRSKQRMQEAVVYDFLHQYYASQLARTRKL